jgi:hypothetical protein
LHLYVKHMTIWFDYNFDIFSWYYWLNLVIRINDGKDWKLYAINLIDSSMEWILYILSSCCSTMNDNWYQDAYKWSVPCNCIRRFLFATLSIFLLSTFRKELLVCLACLTGIHLFVSLFLHLAAVHVNRIWNDDDVDGQDKNNSSWQSIKTSIC